jgi:hypothetical protein
VVVVVDFDYQNSFCWLGNLLVVVLSLWKEPSVGEHMVNSYPSP